MLNRLQRDDKHNPEKEIIMARNTQGSRSKQRQQEQRQRQ